LVNLLLASSSLCFWEDTKNKFYSSVAPEQKAGVRYVDKLRENIENLKDDLKVNETEFG
jgi:hypothetical protein